MCPVLFFFPKRNITSVSDMVAKVYFSSLEVSFTEESPNVLLELKGKKAASRLLKYPLALVVGLTDVKEVLFITLQTIEREWQLF